MSTDKEVILNALQRERDELHDKIMQVDRIIKRVKGLEYSNDNNTDSIQQLEVKVINNKPAAPAKTFSPSSDTKVQILRIFEILGKAAKLSEIQHEYTRLTGSNYKVRDMVRSLNNSKILLMIKDKDSHRGVLWVKKEWVRNGVLLDEFKPEGFDLFYQATNLIYT